MATYLDKDHRSHLVLALLSDYSIVRLFAAMILSYSSWLIHSLEKEWERFVWFILNVIISNTQLNIEVGEVNEMRSGTLPFLMQRVSGTNVFLAIKKRGLSSANRCKCPERVTLYPILVIINTCSIIIHIKPCNVCCNMHIVSW